MKKFLNRLAATLLACAIASSAAFAGVVKTKKITLPRDVMVNGTLLKQGTYKMMFDDQTGELSFIQNKTVVAKTSARLEQRQRRAADLELWLVPQGDGKALRGITFAGDKQKFVIADDNK